jgi:hypothetical protein
MGRIERYRRSVVAWLEKHESMNDLERQIRASLPSNEVGPHVILRPATCDPSGLSLCQETGPAATRLSSLSQTLSWQAGFTRDSLHRQRILPIEKHPRPSAHDTPLTSGRRVHACLAAPRPSTSLFLHAHGLYSHASTLPLPARATGPNTPTSASSHLTPVRSVLRNHPRLQRSPRPPSGSHVHHLPRLRHAWTIFTSRVFPRPGWPPPSWETSIGLI